MPSLNVERFEYKFYLSKGEAEVLASRLDQFFIRDPYSPYRVVSLYFDDGERQALWDKLSGTTLRRKYRLRTYDQGEIIKLEVKERLWHKIRKSSWIVSDSLARALVKGDVNQIFSLLRGHPEEKELRALLAREFWAHLKVFTGVFYYRRAWQWPFSRLRLTLDEEIQSFSNYEAFFDQKGFLLKPFFPKSKVILEIKFNQFFPELYLSLFEDLPKVYAAISKFVFCTLENLDIAV